MDDGDIGLRHRHRAGDQRRQQLQRRRSRRRRGHQHRRRHRRHHVTPTRGLITTESRRHRDLHGQCSTSQPTADVTIGLSSDDTTEGTVSPSTLTFTTTNWNTAQTVTVTGVDDYLDDGDIGYHIVTAAATSGDAPTAGSTRVDVAGDQHRRRHAPASP